MLKIVFRRQKFKDNKNWNLLYLVLNKLINSFVPATEKKFDLIYTKKTIDDKDGVEITCMAEGLYPQPTLNISIE